MGKERATAVSVRDKMDGAMPLLTFLLDFFNELCSIYIIESRCKIIVGKVGCCKASAVKLNKTYYIVHIHSNELF